MLYLLNWIGVLQYIVKPKIDYIESDKRITVFAYYLIGKRTLDEHVANILVDKSYEIDAIMDESNDAYENKEKAKLILAQIHDKIHSK